MANANLEIRTDMSAATDFIAVMEQAVADWTQEHKDQFAAEWKQLEAAGTELCTFGAPFDQGNGLSMDVRFSDDFKAHCAKWGIVCTAVE